MLMSFSLPGDLIPRNLLIAILLAIGWVTVATGQAPSASVELPEIDQLKARLLELGSAPETSTDQGKLRDAIALLEKTITNEASAGIFRQELTTASERAKAARAEIEAIPLPGAIKLTLPDTGQSSAIEDLLVEQRADLAELRNKLAALEIEITSHNARPDKIVARKVELQNELTAAESELAGSADPPEGVGDALTPARILSLARIRAARAETTMLEQERLSFTVKGTRLTTERDLMTRKIEFAEGLLAALVEWQNSQLQKEVSEAATSALKAKMDAVGQHPAVKELAEKMRILSVEFEAITSERTKAGESLREVRFNLEELTRDHLLLKTQLDIDGMSGVFGEVIIDQSRNLPSLAKTRSRLRALRKQQGQARLGQFRIEEDLRPDPAKAPGSLPENRVTDEDDLIRDQISELAAKRTEIQQQIKSEYQRLIRDLGDLELAEHELAEKIAEVGAYLDEKRIWVRGSKVVGLDTIKALPEAIGWLINPKRMLEIPGALKSGVINQPFLSGLGSLLLIGLFTARRRLVDRLNETSANIKQISADRYANTWIALFLTAILTLPIPLLSLSIGGLLLQASDASDWLRGLGSAFLAAASPLATICFIRQLCRSRGLAEAHFKWPKNSNDCLSRNLSWIAVVFIPGLMIVVFTYSREEMGHFDTLGRVVFLFVMGWSAFFMARLLSPQSGIFADRIRIQPRLMMARLATVWFPVMIALPIALGILAAVGYSLAAFSLNRELRFTAGMIFAGVVFYSILLRWGTMRVRRMALEKHLADRQAEVEKAISAGTPEVKDEIAIGEMETRVLDFATVGDQTRRMFRFIAGAAVAITVWYSWADIVPAFQTLDEIKVLGVISLSGLIPALLIVVGTVITARNLPGILEIFLQRFFTLDAGARFAATTIAQYLIIMIGFLFVFNTLGLDWAKFSWIAAALSLGIGFGMQEVVANFVCGIILLFERPIRIGDIVTVSGTTGAVTRIHIRATTITNWDRQEFIVPNKEIVTGSLLNWTLSNAISRIVFTIGVDYGSDTRRVRELLLEILGKQEGILKDPEPIVTFEEFAESSLNFTIRAYIPGLEKRLATLNDLNQSIIDRFREEGISIPFPQRDLNIKTLEQGDSLRSKEGA